jgi:hypothetical protein
MRLKYLIVIFFATALAEQPHHVITFFVKNLNKKTLTVPKNPFMGLTKKIIKENTKTKFPKNIFALYHGYITLSDDLGQITFPRQTHKTNFNLLITDNIKPIFMFPNTISHWQIENETPFKFYKIERKNDKKNSYWHIERGEPTKNRSIPLETIIIIAKPQNILYPTGDFLTTDLPQLVLPDIYLKETFNNVNNALFILQIKKFFASLNSVYKIKETGHSKIIDR